MNRIQIPVALLVAFASALACDEKKSETPTTSSSVTASASVAPRAAVTAASATAAAALATTPTAIPSAPAPSARACEVEIKGKVTGAKGAWIHISAGDCLAGDMLVGRFNTTATGDFNTEVFVKWGSDLTVCAVVPGDAGDKSTMYVKSTQKFHAEKEGEIEFKGLVLTPKPGPEKSFPIDVKSNL